MNTSPGDGNQPRLTEYESLRRQLIARGLPADPIELPEGYIALFEPGSAMNQAHLFRSSGQEAAAPLVTFTDAADFTAWVEGLREAVQHDQATVEDYWRTRIVIIGEADKSRHARKTVTDMVHGEIDALVELHVFSDARGEALKSRLTVSVVEQHVQRGLTTREIIERHMHDEPLSAEEKFAEQVLSCVDELNAFLPKLCSQYQDDLVIAAALAEHVGGALRIFLETGICNSEQAHRVLRHIEQAAFATPQAEQTVRPAGLDTPFRLAISLDPYLTTPIVVERDLTEEEALTLLSCIWDGLAADNPTNEQPAEYLVRLREDSRECVKVFDSKYSFELYRSASCAPPKVRLSLPAVPVKRGPQGTH